MTVKGEYIRRTLFDESSRWLKSQNTVLATKLHSRTGRLVNERSMSVSEQGEMSATMTYQHTIEERFLDMRVLRYGSKLVRRARKIHTPFWVSGTYSVEVCLARSSGCAIAFLKNSRLFFRFTFR